MPKRRTDELLSPGARRQEVASILAKGVTMWHRAMKTNDHVDAKEKLPIAENHLDVSRETRLSVVSGTQRLGPRDDGDEAWA